MGFRSFLRACLAVSLLVLAGAADARAHGLLKRSRPAAGDTLRTVPSSLRLEFTEAPELAVSSIRLLDPLRRDVALAPLRTAGDSDLVLLADIRGALVAGRYTVRWQVAGADGHPVRGEYDFVIAVGVNELVQAAPPPTPPADTAAVAEPVVTERRAATTFDAESLAYVVVRWAQFVGLLLVIGAIAFHHLVLGTVRRREKPSALAQEADTRVIRLAAGGALLLALSSAVRLVAQWTAIRGGGADPAGTSLKRVVLETTWGHAWMLQVAALATFAVGMLLARRAARAPIGWGLSAASALVLALSPALAGHAAAAGAAAVAADAVHVVAAGGWMGGLFMLLAAGIPAARTLPAGRRIDGMSRLVNAFSPTAITFAIILLITGVFASWRNIGSATLLLESRYGQVLLVKLAVLSAAALIGLFNWKRARPMLASTGDEGTMRRAMQAELAAGVLILLVTAVLVATPTPADLGK